jgi:hypothetical protein
MLCFNQVIIFITKKKNPVLYTILFSGFFLVLPGIITAQISKGGMPYPKDIITNTWTLKTLRTQSEIPFVEMPAFNKEELLQEDTLPGNQIGGIRFAYKFFVSLTPENSGLFFTLEDGTKIWRVGIRSTDAFSLNILFSEFKIPPGAKVFIYSPDRTHILGAFTCENEQPGNLFPVAPVNGDEIIIEYIEPANVPFKGKIRIGEVNHDYRGLRLLPGTLKPAECEVDIACNDMHADERRSSCLIIVDGTSYCSGNLINNTSEDGTPYLLTAAHCLFDGRNNFTPSKAATSIFFFNYETPYCYSDIEGSMEMSIAGSVIQANEPKRDMLLLRLNKKPPADYRVFYAGWNATGNVSGPAYCFHHPQGSRKKISIEEDTPYQASFTNGGMFYASSHWRVNRWEMGITEGGSSGSALFDSSNRIIGGLSGGNENINCTNRGDDNFFQLSKNWVSQDPEKSLSSWLDPENSAMLLSDGRTIEADDCIRLTNWTENEIPEETFFPGGYAAGHNDSGIIEFAERFSNEAGGKLYGVYFIPQKGKYIDGSPVTTQVYEGNTYPETLLYEQEIKITSSYYNRRNGNIEESLVETLYKKENYLRFPEPVPVGKTFFIVFKITPVSDENNIFALYHTTDRGTGEKNTAFFKKENKWYPFNENPVSSQPASLSIEPVISLENNSGIEEYHKNGRNTFLAPNPVRDEVTVFFSKNDQPLQLRIIDSSGRILLTENNLKGESYILQTDNLYSRGIYLLQVVYTDYTEVIRFIKQ